MKNPEALTIGKLARHGGVNIMTIRYYERRVLLAAPASSASGYRLCADDAVRRLQCIRQAQLLGFSLSEIQDLLSQRIQPGTTCADIRMRANKKSRWSKRKTRIWNGSKSH